MKHLLALFLVSIALATRSYAEENRLPDIVVYLADDLSAGDLSFYGGNSHQTQSNSGKCRTYKHVVSSICAKRRWPENAHTRVGFPW